MVSQIIWLISANLDSWKYQNNECLKKTLTTNHLESLQSPLTFQVTMFMINEEVQKSEPLQQFSLGPQVGPIGQILNGEYAQRMNSCNCVNYQDPYHMLGSICLIENSTNQKLTEEKEAYRQGSNYYDPSSWLNAFKGLISYFFSPPG